MYRCCKLEYCARLGYYAASNGNFVKTFRDNLSVPSSGFRNPKDSLLSQYGVCGYSPVSHYHNCYNFFYHGTSLSKAVLTTTLPSLSNTSINATGWHHATETSHRPHFSIYKPRIGTKSRKTSVRVAEGRPWLRFSVIFLSCKANGRVFDAKSGHGPHSPPGRGGFT